MRVVLDTNVVVAGVRSPTGASAQLLRLVAAGRLIPVCSPALFLEYEDVLKRPDQLLAAGITSGDVDRFLDGLATLIDPAGRGIGLRPKLTDPDDEMVFECAVWGRAEAIVTFEINTFREAAALFGLEIMTPGQLCARMEP